MALLVMAITSKTILDPRRFQGNQPELARSIHPGVAAAGLHQSVVWEGPRKRGRARRGACRRCDPRRDALHRGRETSNPSTTTSVTTETFCPEPSNPPALGGLGRRKEAREGTARASSLGRYDRPLIREGDRDRPVLVRPPDLRPHPVQLRERVRVGMSVGIRLAESGVSPPLPRDVGSVHHDLSHNPERPS